MPAASQVQVHGSGADRVAALRPDLLAPARRALQADLPLDDLRHADPEAFRALNMMVEAAYLTEPRWQRLLRYPGRAATAAGYSDADVLELRELVRPVCERGSIWHCRHRDAGVSSLSHGSGGAAPEARPTPATNGSVMPSERAMSELDRTIRALYGPQPRRLSTER